MKEVSEDVRARASKIKLVLMDCDGVLTDGKIYFSDSGEETKAFNIKDGQGIVSLHKAGILTGVITGRSSKALEIRVAELGMRFLKQKSADKVADFENILGDAGLTAAETAYIGDDIPDITLLKKVGLAVAVADSAAELFDSVHYITGNNGGEGAVREVADLILAQKS